MRRILAVVLVSSLIACGGGSGDGHPTGALVASGPTHVAPVESVAISGSGTCVEQGVSVGLSMVAVIASDATNLCSMLTANDSKANMRSVFLAVMSGTLGAPPAIGPGKYEITQSPAVGAVVSVGAAAVDVASATCVSTTTDATSGFVWIDALTATSVTGAVDAMLPDGTHITGAFDAPRCGLAIPVSDICAGTFAPPTGTCLP
ncbi:MAG TPA: hypothetical protein VFP50_08560 [Anaeromyxobacteraceae bacterium]|nr:hypothetical protein [Anaeromyxobacteraceae bacterium]